MVFNDLIKVNVKTVIVLLVLSILTTMTSLVVPFSILIIFDRIIPNAAEGSLIVLSGVIFFSIFLDYFIKRYESGYLLRMSSMFEEKINNMLFKHLCYANILDFEKLSKGEYIQRIQAINSIKDYFSGDWVKSIINSVVCFIICILITLVDVRAGLVLILVSLGLMITAYRSHVKNERVLVDKSDKEGVSQTKIVEMVSSPISLKSAAMEYRLENYMRGMISDREKTVIKHDNEQALLVLLINYAQQLTIVLVVIFSAKSVIDLSISQGVMAAVVLLVNRYFAPLQQVIQALSNYRMNRRQLDRLSDIVNLYDPSYEQSNDNSKITTIGFYLDHQAHINSIEQGVITVVNGDSGAGKSYLMQCLNFEHFDPSLKLTINDSVITEQNRLFWRNDVIRVDRNSAFVEGSIIDNITCYQPNLYKVAYSLCDAMFIKDAIDLLPMGFYTEINTASTLPFSRQVSFSLMIIRALLSEKSLLIVDDIDLVYDSDFGANLLSCLRPRIDRLACVLVSNRLAEDNIDLTRLTCHRRMGTEQ